MFRTIAAKYPGTCKRCGGAFEIGTRIRFGGGARTYHLKAECPAGVDSATAAQVIFSATNGAAGRPAFDEDADDVIVRAYENRGAT